jgi:hypothetical protein
MKKFTLLLAITLPFVVFYSCKHDPILPEHQVSFNDEIYPIISSSCWHSGCHNDTMQPEGQIMMTYDQIVNVDYVVPGKPHSSKIYESVIGAGEEFMPKDPYPPLNNRQIRLLYIWIAQGAKNN